MIPVYEEFYNTVLDYLKDNKEHVVADINNYCVKKHNITEEDKKLVYESSGVNIVYARVHWALTYLKMAKLIDNIKRGMYKITEEGIKASKDTDIDNKYLEKYDTDFNRKAGINEIDASMKTCRSLLEKAIEDIADDKKVFCDFVI